jgi:hypothetical protein
MEKTIGKRRMGEKDREGAGERERIREGETEREKGRG